MSDTVATAPLGQNIKVLSGFAFPSAGFSQLEGLPLIRIRDLARADTEVRYRGQYDPAYLIKRGDVLIGMDGDFEVHRWNGDAALLNQRVCKVEAVTRQLDQGFLYWYLKPRVAEIHRRTPQTTVRHLSASDLYLVPQPPISAEEQSTVAQVLDTLDTAIHETEAIIAKLKAVKQGLLHDLLRRGIDANGELRPPQAEAPHLYKESPLGWIPKDWEARSLASLGTYENGYAFSDAHWSEHGLPIVRIAQITGSQPGADRYPGTLPDRFKISDGDLIFSWSGTLVVIRWSGGSAWLNQHLFKVTPARDVNSTFMFHLLQASVDEMNKRTHGSTMKHIKRGELASYFVALPSDGDEQARIADHLEACDESVHQNSMALASLRDLKSGLMDDLLTGRVRVTPLLAAQPQGSA